MPTKSWAFKHEGHVVRAEFRWRFDGKNRKRIYVDHQRAARTHGRLTAMRPLPIKIGGKTIQIRFHPRWFGLDMDCEISVDDAGFERVENAFVDKGWGILHPDDDADDVPGFGNRIGCLFVFPMLIGLAILSIPMVMVGVVMHSLGERRLRRQLRQSDRMLSWPEIQERMKLQDSPSTLIQQVGQWSTSRVWWTSDDVMKRSPLPQPKWTDLTHPIQRFHPFTECCDYEYLDAKKGTAFFAEIPELMFGSKEIFDSSPPPWHDQFPLLKLVRTGYAYGKRRKTMAEFAGILGDDLEAAVPRLLAALDSQDPTIHRLALECIGLAGERAAGAVPQIAQKFYLGPNAERHFFARILAGLDPAGTAVLREASTMGDPRIATNARSGLSMRERSDARPATVEVRN